MSRTLSIHTDDLLDDALRERAQTQGKTVPEMAREILRRALLGQRQRPLIDPQPSLSRRVESAKEIVAHGKDVVQAVKEAKAKGVAVPYVFYVESARPPGVVRMRL